MDQVLEQLRAIRLEIQQLREAVDKIARRVSERLPSETDYDVIGPDPCWDSMRTF